jgi:voltage-gated potassium channel
MITVVGCAVAPDLDTATSQVRAALRPLSAFTATVVAGLAGFAALPGVGVVDAAFWLLDPTSIELHFQHHDGPERLTKAYAVVVFAALVVAGVWVGESVLDAAFDGKLTNELQRMRSQQAIDDLTDHTVICGYGMFGRTVADRLDRRGDDVVVVESDGDVATTAAGDDRLLVQGDARDEAVLRRAGVDRARAVVAGIDDSNANIQIAIVTSQLAPDSRLVVRVGDEMYESVARRSGADDVVIPEVVSGTDVVDGL